MSIDSTANLLFTIGADSEDAEKNIQRFRTILNKDLSGIGAEFEQWSTHVLGDISTIQGAAIAAGALVGAGLVAVAGFAVEAAEKYSHFVDEVARGTKTTGISMENMSKLKFAADLTNTSYEALTGGLTKFASNVVKAAQGSEQQVKAFAALGVTHAQVVAGEKDLNGLLMIVADRFHELGSRVLQTAEARELFGRGGADLVKILSQGSAGLHEMGEEAAQLGLVLSGKDKEANDAYKLSIHTLKAEVEGFVVSVGREALPLLTSLAAHLIGFAQAIEQSFQRKADWADFATLGIKPWIETFQRAGVNADTFKLKMEALAKSLSKFGDGAGGGNSLIDAPKVEKTKEAWYGLSDVLERVKLQLAGVTSEEAKVFEEMDKLSEETRRKLEELGKKVPKDDLEKGTFERESAAAEELLKLIPTLYQKLMDDIASKRKSAGEKAYSELLYQLDKSRQARTEAQALGWAAEEADRLQKAAAQKAAFDSEMASLAKHLEQIQASHQTAAERIQAQYLVDVEKFTAAEEKKRLVAEPDEIRRTVIAQQYAAIRAALLVKEGQDLQALRNSQGWRGVFGNEFAQMIRGNEALSREWATSTNQSLMMVRVTMEGLKEAGQQAFGQLAQGMGQNIASALIYKKSIGEAMRSALASTLESLAAESITWAIYSTALGFTRLAQHDYEGSGEAFTAAAIWGSVGAASAVAGRAIAPSQTSSTTSASTGTSSSSGTTTSDSTASTSQQQHVTVNVWGHVFGVSGVEELTSAINDAVLNKDVTLTATNTKTGVQVTR